MGRLINAYGVTETTVYNSISIFGREDCYKNSIGKFFNNTSYYLLDKHLRPIPAGAVGELHLAGQCVSQGYLQNMNMEENNKKNFVTNPFTVECAEGDANSILYRTGDLVRLNASGDLEYLGRNDNQIKIRGFRVELQEIECAVLNCKQIKQCAVIFENNSLACIFVKDEDYVNTEELYAFLDRSLPKHMIPVLIEYQGQSLPVTGNGKLDTKALKDVYRARNTTSEYKYTAPRNKLENELCKIFSTVLGLAKKSIGIDADFFHIGGDSISSLLLAGKIRNQLGMRCNVKNIFEHRTVRRICDNLSCVGAQRVNGFSTNHINGKHYDEDIRPSGVAPLLPIQNWFFAKNLQSAGHWNQTFAFEVPQLDVEILIKSLQTLVNHHDAFRLRFKNDAVVYTQYYENVESLDVHFYQFDVTGLQEDEVSSKLSTLSTFNITKGPLYAVVYLHHNSGQCKVWWTIHHLIVDSVSWRVIKDDLQTLYEGGSLSAKGTSYKEFSLALSNQFSSEKLYWESIVNKVHLYNAHFTKARQSTNFKFSLDETTSQQLYAGVQSSKNKTNIQDYLLAAVGYSLRRLTNSSINYVTIEGHGREQIDPHFDLSNTVGWFTSMYPLEMHTDPDSDIQSNIDNVNKALTSTPNKGMGYGAIYGYTDPPMPCVAFNFLGTFNGSNSGTEWNFCDLSLGLSSGGSEKISSTAIDITGAYDRGSLKFSMDFCLNQEKCQDFIETFQKSLKQISDNLEVVDESSLPFGDFETYYEFPAYTKTEVALFILPPGEGGAESYFNNLVPNLKDRNIVVFNNFYLERQPMETSFEELAAMYIKYVKKIQSKGPYNFLGWSFGGVLALEMSRQMMNSGDCINNLFLIDSYLNVSKAVIDLHIGENSEVIDRINHKYNPTHKDYDDMCSKTQNIVLFKATLLNEMYKSKNQYLLYEYFRKSQFNNLDDLIPSTFIEIHEMVEHSHHTWSKDTKQVISISNAVADKLLFDKNGHF